MACFFSIPFSNNPYITPWGTIGPDGILQGPDTALSGGSESRMPDDCGAGGYPYYVQPGDTLRGIAEKLGVSPAAIIEANHELDPYRLSVGQMICIPACPPDHTARYIQPGDTLAGIAREYGTSVESILESNPGIDPNYLRIGQRLCIFRYTLRPYTGV